ncbi:2-amino-4-hydroxy-6-hydroxymethyldihydropteridine diphosphokinase [Microbulbifer sp. 2304DJ12-6]|uniref:2-amino-4-hydroxy-6- hydroxymethyldihydropteridine diphosphokinase n=1 Tax=Microbulbifer sp. 2304DJ12-6 TaxID=3233340 RepID=UPI00262F11D4|nr:2-amino-4-hydroxy-6-hydroxymethyldihydropteridine diphosphokinase [uncultured Microbulbifer sp.]
MDTAYIGLGSNLAQPQKQLRNALVAMGEIPQSQLLRCSGFYRSAPLGPSAQPDYINAVTELHTELCPLSLLEQLQAIEAAHGRERSVRWGARTLDLDILLFGPKQIDSLRLQVPHPRMFERNFVLVPLAELTPNLRLPSGETLAQLLQNCPHNRLEKI